MADQLEAQLKYLEQVEDEIELSQSHVYGLIERANLSLAAL